MTTFSIIKFYQIIISGETSRLVFQIIIFLLTVLKKNNKLDTKNFDKNDFILDYFNAYVSMRNATSRKNDFNYQTAKFFSKTSVTIDKQSGN